MDKEKIREAVKKELVEWTHFTSREVEYGTLNIAVDSIIKALCKELPYNSKFYTRDDVIAAYFQLKQWGKDD